MAGVKRVRAKRAVARTKPVRAIVETGAAALPSTAALPAPAAEGCAEFVRRRVAQELPTICESLLEKAREGDAAVLKTLWQLAGLAKLAEEASGPAEDAGVRGEVYARRVLKRLRCTSSSDAAGDE